MTVQLDIFSLPTQARSSTELPKAILPVKPDIEEAVKGLLELKKIVINQFAVGTRVIAGDLHGEVASVTDEILCFVHFDGEAKPRQVFTDSLELEPTKPELVEGCTVRSDLFFKGKTAKVLKIEQIHTVAIATVELDFKGTLIKFPCGTRALEVVA